MSKPRCGVPETTNIIAITAAISSLLRDHGQEKEAKEMEEWLKDAHGYNQRLLICAKYVDFII
jgi:hypothetical protein